MNKLLYTYTIIYSHTMGHQFQLIASLGGVLLEKRHDIARGLWNPCTCVSVTWQNWAKLGSMDVKWAVGSKTVGIWGFPEIGVPPNHPF